MIRRLFIVACIASTLLCITSVGAWINSERYTDAILAPLPHGRVIGALIDRGTFGGWVERDRNAFRWQWMHREAVGIREIDLEPGARFGFAVDWGPSDKAILVPLWFVSIAGLLGTAGLAWLARRTPEIGLCWSCGYDLRASNDRCPECGTEITSNAGTPV